MNRRLGGLRDAPDTLASADQADAAGSLPTSRQSRMITDAGPAIDVPAPPLPDYHLTETILAHPRFPEARQAHAEAILGLYGNDPTMNRLLIEAGRSVIFLNLLTLHAAYDEADRDMDDARPPAGRHGRLRCLQRTPRPGHHRPAREGRLRAVGAGSLGSAGPHPGADRQADRPRSRLARCLLLSLQILFPDPGYGPAMRRDLSYRKAHRIAACSMLAYSRHLMADNQPMMFFMSRDGGSMIIFELVAQAGTTVPAPAQRVSFTDMGRRFGISRTQVRETFEAAARRLHSNVRP